MDLRDGRYTAPSTPAAQVFFDTATPTTGGVIFDPNTPAAADTLYVSSLNGSTWIYQDGAYITYTAPVVNNTEWYITGTTIDAGGNKTTSITRNGVVLLDTNQTGFGMTVYNNKNSGASNGLLITRGSGSSGGYGLQVLKGSTNQLRVNNDGSLLINDAYTFPATDGTANYFLKTNGLGVLSWAAAGLSYFTEAQSTSGVNATVYANTLSASAGVSNADFVAKAKGTGAFLLRTPDGTTTGGNKRGSYAVDLQMETGYTATMVAASNYSFCGPGTRLTTNTGTFQFIGNGDRHTATGNYDTIMNGYFHTASGGYNFIGNGQQNTTSALYCTAINGYGNTASGLYAFVGGNSNTSSGNSSFVYGFSNTGSGNYTTVFGYTNTATYDAGFTIGKSGVNATATKFVIGGDGYTAGGSQLGILGLTVRTTNATATELGVAGAPTDVRAQLGVSDNQAMRVRGSIIGKQSGSTNVSVWDFDYVIVRGVGVGTTALVGSANINVVTNIPAWGTPTITADSARGYASIKVIGASATNIQWMARIDSTETLYA